MRHSHRATHATHLRDAHPLVRSTKVAWRLLGMVFIAALLFASHQLGTEIPGPTGPSQNVNHVEGR